MKKLLSFGLALCLILGLCACNEPDPPIEENPVPNESTPEVPEEPENYWEKNMPKMDGSTSLIPLEAGIRSALLGISMEEATAQVAHSTTHGSFYNLLNGDADLVFSVPISDSQAEAAAEQGVELEQIPVAKEGFVFVVNAKNPVDGLTQEQLRDIYSGKIKNWKEVGGNDEEIIAYQRNRDSGSQNYMTVFMGDSPLIDAPKDLRPATMSGLMDVIAVNDYAEQSIGYSVYAYAADMYGNGDEIKFLAVDGVEPSKATMASGEYPLLSDNYAIFRADEPEDSPVRKLCDWMVSDEGQIAIAKAGYVTVRDIGFDYSNSEKPTPLSYSGTGSGYLENWDIPTWKCVAGTPENVDSYDYYYYETGRASLPLKVTLPENIPEMREYPDLTPYTTGIKYELECLTNKVLQKEINAFLAEAVKEADEHSDELFSFLENINTGDFSPYHQINEWSVFETGYPSAIVHVKAQNGYIWATVAQMYIYDVQDGYEKYYRTQCCTWDLATGKELSVEDLFRKGLDVDEFLNAFLRKASQTPIDSWGTYPQMKADFVNLPESGWAISPEAIYIDYGNPYFGEGYKFYFNYESGVLCSEVFRDMEGMFTDSVKTGFYLNESPHKPIYAYNSSNDYDIQLLDETVGNSKIRAEINKDFLNKIKDITYANAAEYFSSIGNPIKEEEIYSWYSWYLTEYGERFAIFTSSGSIDLYSDDEDKYIYWIESAGSYIYDLETGKEITWLDLLAEDWRDPTKLGRHPDNLPPFDILSINYSTRQPQPYPLMFKFMDYTDYSSREIYLPVNALKAASELPK